MDFCGTQGVVILSYAVIFYTGRKICSKLRESQNIMSQQTRLAQQQLSKILMIESAIPFLVMGVPITFVIASVIIGFNIPLIGLAMATMASCIPLVNAICIIFIVPSYRRCFVQMFCFKSQKSTKTESTADGKTVAFITNIPYKRKVEPAPSD